MVVQIFVSLPKKFYFTPHNHRKLPFNHLACACTHTYTCSTSYCKSCLSNKKHPLPTSAAATDADAAVDAAAVAAAAALADAATAADKTLDSSPDVTHTVYYFLY